MVYACIGPKGCLTRSGYLILIGVLLHAAILNLFFDRTISELEWHIGIFAPPIVWLTSLILAHNYARFRLNQVNRKLRRLVNKRDRIQRQIQQVHEAEAVMNELNALLEPRDRQAAPEPQGDAPADIEDAPPEDDARGDEA